MSFLEISDLANPEPMIDYISQVLVDKWIYAKVRMGGVTANLIPPPSDEEGEEGEAFVHDTEVIEEMSDFLTWERQPLERTDEDVVRHYDKVMETAMQWAEEIARYILIWMTMILLTLTKRH